jgi:hypothetical protein
MIVATHAAQKMTWINIVRVGDRANSRMLYQLRKIQQTDSKPSASRQECAQSRHSCVHGFK